MGRWILLLPLCLFARDGSLVGSSESFSLGDEIEFAVPADTRSKFAVDQASHAAALVALSHEPLSALIELPFIKGYHPPAASVAALLALADSPWSGAALAPAFEEEVNTYYERLRHVDPLAYLEEALAYSEHAVRGYRANFRKREKVGGSLRDPEQLEVCYRDKPFSVYMNWVSKARLNEALKVIYVEGENEGKLVALPALTFLPIQMRDVNGADAKASSRYTIDNFGMHKGMQRTVVSMKDAQSRGKLFLRYLGEGQDSRLGDVTCHIFVRKPYYPLEEEGLNELTIFIDKQTGLQVGSILKDTKGELIAEYFFRDIEVNPTFSAEQFTRAILSKKK